MIEMAPVAVFCFNRPNHLARTLKALERNRFAEITDIFIFSDGAKAVRDERLVLEVRKVCSKPYGFKSINLVERELNLGLAKNIREGVTEVVSKYGSIIVLEDDHETSINFLAYMNNALKRYEYEASVFHINGWSPIESNKGNSAFFLKSMFCWGWATWENRWRLFDAEPSKLINEFTLREIREFNLGNSVDNWAQVLANYSGKIDTWAIFWYATIFAYGGICLTPPSSLVFNNGLDGSGTNSGVSKLNQNAVSNDNITDLPPNLSIDQGHQAEIAKINKKGNIFKSLPLSRECVYTFRAILGKVRYLKDSFILRLTTKL